MAGLGAYLLEARERLTLRKEGRGSEKAGVGGACEGEEPAREEPLRGGARKGGGACKAGEKVD